MSFVTAFAIKNLKGRPKRTLSLILLTAFLSLTVFGGSLIVLSLSKGLESYGSRLGADIVVVPAETRAKASLESILLQGIPGYFYMDSANLQKIRATEGVAAATPQFFLASASSGCCSVAVQIIGFDPQTDISIRPWIDESFAGSIGEGDIVVGSDITVPKDKTLTFYDTPCRVAAQLARTGTGLDSAVYADMNTIARMMTNAGNLGFSAFEDVSVANSVSAVMVKVAEGYDIEKIANDLNIHLRRVEATPAKSMVSDIAGGLRGVSRAIGALTVMIWLLAMVILGIVFTLSIHERAKEFAVLRLSGASEKLVRRLLRRESVVVSVGGAALGVVLGALLVLPFGALIGQRLALPYLMPSFPVIIALACGSLLVAAFAAVAAAGFVGGGVLRKEAGILLREE